MNALNKGATILPGCSTLPPMVRTDKPNEHPKRKGNKKTRDRFAVLNGFVDCSIAELTRAELATWLILYRDTRNGTACTAQTDIARRAGLSVRSIQKAVKKLVASGLVVVVYRGGLNRGSSRYRVESQANRG